MTRRPSSKPPVPNSSDPNRDPADEARLLEVAEALERRLAAAAAESEGVQVGRAERLARSSAYVARLERRLAELEERLSDASADEGRRRRQLALELAYHREENLVKDTQLAELRELCHENEQELRRLSAREAQLGDLAARLEASEEARAAQDRELLASQRRIQELEDQLGTVASLLQAGKGSDDADPGAMLEELAERLTHVERVRSQQQGAIDRLSHSLAVQQVDDALDDAQSRRNAVRRVDDAVQRSRRFGVPTICLMIGIDRQSALREEHGSVLFDFILVQVAHRLQLALRRRDVVMRYGDGEFLLITDAETVEAAESHALRLVRAVCAEPLDLGGRRVEIGASVAVLPYHRDMGEAPEVIRRARQCLLEAQAQGERQILVGSTYEFGAPPPEEPGDEGRDGRQPC